MKLSFERAAETGHYHSICCRHFLAIPPGKLLPLCPACREHTEWQPIMPSAPPSPLRNRKALRSNVAGAGIATAAEAR